MMTEAVFARPLKAEILANLAEHATALAVVISFQNKTFSLRSAKCIKHRVNDNSQ